MNHLELINDLILQAKEIEYHNGKLDSVTKRADMIIRKIFGNDSHYLKLSHSIRYGPSIYSSLTPQSTYEKIFYNGKEELINLLNVIAEDIQLESESSEAKKEVSYNKPLNRNVFIVHGHNEEMKFATARTLEKLNLIPVILHEQPNQGKTIIEKFTSNSEVIYAVVLLSADDIAYNKNQKPETPKLRPRQNVIFELGFFIGKLGRERVFLLHEQVENFELPSDYSGVVFVPFDKAGKWQFELVKELKTLGVEVDANKIL